MCLEPCIEPLLIVYRPYTLFVYYIESLFVFGLLLFMGEGHDVFDWLVACVNWGVYLFTILQLQFLNQLRNK